MRFMGREYCHFLHGAYADVVEAGEALDFEAWRDCVVEAVARAPPHGSETLHWRAVLSDHDLAATLFRSEQREEATLAKTTKKRRVTRRPAARGETLTLPTDRRTPVNNPWEYAYLITGEKKIGKTTLAIEGGDVLVIQFDKPQIAYSIIELCPRDWREFERILKALEAAAADGTFPYDRVVVDGVGEWWQMATENVCPPGVKDPGELDDYGKTWRALATLFTKTVNRLLRLQIDAKCGLMFIAHSEWKEVKTRDGTKVDRLKPNLTGRCEEILNGKVDAWFQYDYAGSDRVLVTQGSETIAAGHRIDGHFLTRDGRRVQEILMGDSPAEALAAFLAAFNNEAEHASHEEIRAKRRTERTRARTKTKKRRVRRGA